MMFETSIFYFFILINKNQTKLFLNFDAVNIKCIKNEPSICIYFTKVEYMNVLFGQSTAWESHALIINLHKVIALRARTYGDLKMWCKISDTMNAIWYSLGAKNFALCPLCLSVFMVLPCTSGTSVIFGIHSSCFCSSILSQPQSLFFLCVSIQALI